MKTYFLYARYSSDLQNPKSCEDQLAVCRQYVDERGGYIAGEYMDEAKSGRTINRKGLENLLLAVENKPGSVILCESLDRISRDQADISYIFKKLNFQDVSLVTIHDGDVNSLHIGVKGYLSQLYIEDLAKKTLRGQIAKVKSGFIAGGVCYGYSQRREYDPDTGDLIKGLREINEEEAAIIREIFTSYANGVFLNDICRDLNAREIPGPGGKGWKINTLQGNRKRLTGLLNNPLYVGKSIFNRQRYVLDPDTQKKRSKLNPPSEWVVTEVPELRIVDDQTWEEVKLRQAAKEMKPGYKYYSPLSPKMKCKCCGKAIWAVRPGTHYCSTHYRTKSCENKSVIKMSMVMAKAGESLKRALKNGGEDILQRIRLKAEKQKGDIEKEIEQIARRISNLLDYVAEGTDTRDTRKKIAELEQNKAKLKRQLLKTVTNERPFEPIYQRVLKFKSLHMDPDIQQDLADLVIKIEIDAKHRVYITPDYEAIYRWLVKQEEK